MQSEEDTRARLVQFFSERPHLLKIIVVEPSHVEVWEEIFFYFFKERPVDDTTKEVPSYWRPGSTDPRWDTLLFKCNLGAMRALDTLVKEWREAALLSPPYTEAA